MYIISRSNLVSAITFKGFGEQTVALVLSMPSLRPRAQRLTAADFITILIRG